MILLQYLATGLINLDTFAVRLASPCGLAPPPAPWAASAAPSLAEGSFLTARFFSFFLCAVVKAPAGPGPAASSIP